ncbi:MAG: hypothetical protein IH614_14335, partial [Desulfuromonadales bacterium]|nr:hypothetical protein [Desulfuromonadales bacterium]
MDSGAVVDLEPIRVGNPAREWGDEITLTGCLHPFRTERVDLQLPAVGSIFDMLQAAGLPAGCSAHVWVEGQYVPPERWRRAYPKAGARVVIRVVPQGGEGGGKNTLRMVLMIVVAVVAAWVSGGAGGAAIFAKGGALAGYAGVAGVAVGVVGALAINALIPPPTPKLPGGGGLSLDRAHAITGTRNQLVPYGVIPKIYGRHRLYPPLGALPYTEAMGGEQFYRMLFVVGYGPLAVSELKIGETPIDQYQGVEIEIREGTAADEPLTLFSESVYEEGLSVLLEQDDQFWFRAPTEGYCYEEDYQQYCVQWHIGWWHYNAAPTAWVTRTTQAADTISLDFTAPSGLFYVRRKGRLGSVYIDLDVQYAPAGSNNWAPAPFAEVAGNGSINFAGSLRIEGMEAAVKRVGVRWPVATGAYDVRVRRVYTQADMDDKDEWKLLNVVDSLYWTALRSIPSEDPVISALPLCKIVLRIKATDQLSGILDQFNLVAQAKLPVYDGAAWSAPQPTSSPAWAYADVFCGRANAKALPHSRLDPAALTQWAQWCELNSIRFDAVIDGRTTVYELARDVAAVGLAAWTIVDGRYSVVRDLPQGVAVQHFTPRNSWGFRGNKVFRERVHGLRVRFLNAEKGWQQDELIVYDDGYGVGNATEFEVLQLFGVTTPGQAWKCGRYHIAVARLRPETYELWADVEQLICTRGDLVRVSHDVPLWGGGQGRIKDVLTDGPAVTAITLDDVVVMEAGKNYGVRVRGEDGSSFVSSVQTIPGETSQLTLVLPIAGPQVGDLVMFGEADRETVELVVKAIEPGPDLTARLVLVDAAPGVHQAWTGEIPPFDSQITLPAERSRLPGPAPSIDGVSSGRGVAILEEAGYRNRLVVSYSIPPGSTIGVRSVQCEYRRTGMDDTWKAGGESLSLAGQFSVAGVLDGEAYDVRVRSISLYGTPSPWTVAAHVIASLGAPDQPASLVGQKNGNFLRLSLAPHGDPRVTVGGSYAVRFQREFNPANVSWDKAMDLADGIPGSATSMELPLMWGTYLVKALTANGVESAEAASFQSIYPRQERFREFYRVTQGGFPGAKTGLAVVGSALEFSLGVETGEYLFSLPWPNLAPTYRLDYNFKVWLYPDMVITREAGVSLKLYIKVYRLAPGSFG